MAAMPIYGKKPLKIFFSRTEDALWQNLCINYQGWEVYQNCQNNGRTLTFDFLRRGQVCFPMDLYGGKNVENFI